MNHAAISSLYMDPPPDPADRTKLQLVCPRGSDIDNEPKSVSKAIHKR